MFSSNLCISLKVQIKTLWNNSSHLLMLLSSLHSIPVHPLKSHVSHTLPNAGVVKRYTQAYNYEGAQNYTSPHIHSAIANGLDPGTRYYYRVGGLGRNLWSEVV